MSKTTALRVHLVSMSVHLDMTSFKRRLRRKTSYENVMFYGGRELTRANFEVLKKSTPGKNGLYLTNRRVIFLATFL